MCKIISERNGEKSVIDRFIHNEGSANEILLPLLIKIYPNLLDESDWFILEDDVLRQAFRDLEPLNFHLAPAHILGDAFQALMGPRLRGDKGQFFTPRALVKTMVSVLNPPISAKIVDPACGTGGFLVESQAYHASDRDRNSISKYGKLIGLEKDKDLCRLSEAILQIVAPNSSSILNTNSLDFHSLCKMPSDMSPLDADFVITNPPFGSKIKITDLAILAQFALGHKWEKLDTGWKKSFSLRDSQDPQILFLELSILLLRPGWKMAIVLPEGVFGNYGLGYVWDFVRSQGTILALIDCPRNTFQPYTDTKTNVLFFQKYELSRETSISNSDTKRIWMAVAIHCGHDRRGRTLKVDGRPHPNDFQSISNSFPQRETDTSFWQKSEIVDPYYLVPRYYDMTPFHNLEKEAKRLGSDLISLGEMMQEGFLDIRKGHEVGADAYGTGDVPFIRTSDIANYEISIDPTRSFSNEVYNKFVSQQRLAPGDILIVCDGRYRIGRTAILHEHNYQCVVQSHFRIITLNASCPICEKELLYLLNLPMVKLQIRNLVFIQSTLGSLGKRLYEIKIPMPKQTNEWKSVVQEFWSLIERRAQLLMQIQKFEHPGYEL